MKKIVLSLFAGIILLTAFDLKAKALSVSAASSCLIEAQTGEVLFSENADERRAMASTTKIMTALLTIEAGGLDREFVVDEYAIMVEGTSMGLQKGDIVSRRDLLYGIILPSGNDAANAAAVSVSGSIPAFVELMNKKAEALGLSDTHFANPSGLDAKGHYTTARDLAVLAAYAMKNELFREIASTRAKQLEYGNPPYKRTLYNSNKMLAKYDGAIGVKTGFTDNARRCLVSAAERNGTTLIAVTLNDANDWQDHINMLDYGFSVVKPVPLETSCSSRVSVAGTGKTVGVYAENANISLTSEGRTRLERRVLLPRMVYGDVKRGDILGSIEYYLSGKKVKTVPLLADSDVFAAKGGLNIFQRLFGALGIYI